MCSVSVILLRNRWNCKIFSVDVTYNLIPSFIVKLLTGDGIMSLISMEVGYNLIT